MDPFALSFVPFAATRLYKELLRSSNVKLSLVSSCSPAIQTSATVSGIAAIVTGALCLCAQVMLTCTLGGTIKFS